MSGEYQPKLTLTSESLRNDGWCVGAEARRRPAAARSDSRGRARLLPRTQYPSFGNLAPRDIASRAAKRVCDEGRGVGPGGLGVYLDFADAITRLGAPTIRERYGNLFEMYERITDEDPYECRCGSFPAVHYTMGGLWVDYNLMSTIPGLHVIGEANFSDHGANRLGASALMQGLADGYFIVPNTIGNYLASTRLPPSFRQDEAEVSSQTARLLSIRGTLPVEGFHRARAADAQQTRRLARHLCFGLSECRAQAADCSSRGSRRSCREPQNSRRPGPASARLHRGDSRRGRRSCLADHVEARDRAHQVVVDPQPAHRVVHGRIDAHRHFVRILVRDALVHLEQIAVALADGRAPRRSMASAKSR